MFAWTSVLNLPKIGHVYWSAESVQFFIQNSKEITSDVVILNYAVRGYEIENDCTGPI